MKVLGDDLAWYSGTTVLVVYSAAKLQIKRSAVINQLGSMHS